MAEAFNIDIPKSDLVDLQHRLARTRLPDQLEGTSWEYGTDLNYVKELLRYWQNDFDWRKQERFLNSFPNFKLEVNGINLHFVHEVSQRPDATPLLLLHGWPGSYFEFHKMIRHLTNPADPQEMAFHVVAPSLPGFGFSSAPQRPGFGIKAIAATVNELMQRLGYDRYVAQGGDWGGTIVYALGALHADSCAAIHCNMAMCKPVLSNPWHLLQVANARLPFINNVPLVLSRAELAVMKQMKLFEDEESGYMELQRTKPQTPGYALNDSPAGLAAYIVEKFWRWGDTRGDVESRFSKDELLTNIAIYWFNQNITSSFRIYREFGYSYSNQAGEMAELLNLCVEAPTAVANFPAEMERYPRAWIERQYNLKQWSVFDSGGHFAALEEPQLLMADMRKHFANWH